MWFREGRLRDLGLRSQVPVRPEFDSDLCGEGRVGEISRSSPNEAPAGTGVCLRGFGLA